MKRPLTVISLLAIVLNACNDSATDTKNTRLGNVQIANTIKYEGLQGTWVHHSKGGFTLIEIKDTSDVIYYQFADRKATIDTVTADRYWYYTSKARMGYWNNVNNPVKSNVDIWISTDRYRIDYQVKGDTLIEFDKMGEQERFIKVTK
ncbi:MAG TPA: hypothetical protein VEC36_13510 [Patescibacteria group bacterium]|nr:hypothetical protein [Patescibacteria group bacterium]